MSKSQIKLARDNLFRLNGVSRLIQVIGWVFLTYFWNPEVSWCKISLLGSHFAHVFSKKNTPIIHLIRDIVQSVSFIASVGLSTISTKRHIFFLTGLYYLILRANPKFSHFLLICLANCRPPLLYLYYKLRMAFIWFVSCIGIYLNYFHESFEWSLSTI